MKTLPLEAKRRYTNKIEDSHCEAKKTAAVMAKMTQYEGGDYHIVITFCAYGANMVNIVRWLRTERTATAAVLSVVDRLRSLFGSRRLLRYC